LNKSHENSLDDASIGQCFVVSGFAVSDDDSGREQHKALARMMEMGLIEGAVVRKLYAAPFSRDPIAIEVDGHLIALRRTEAKMVMVVADQAGARH
jgi:Fe2+ transport system protein FeoA